MDDLFQTIELDSYLNEPVTSIEHFDPIQLKRIFNDKIAKTQATGKDGIRIGHFAKELDGHTTLIQHKVINKTYKFTSYKERLSLRGATRNPRQLSVPTVRDRIVLRVLCDIIHKHVPRSRGPSPHALIHKLAKKMRSIDEPQALIRIDVQNFFPSINHKILKREMKFHKLDDLTIDLCMRAVSTSTGDIANSSNIGIPQGLSISGALAGLFMLRFDDRQSKKGYSYFRYVDDILIIMPLDKAHQALDKIRKSLRPRGLKIHPQNTPSKTLISNTTDGIDFLGYNITQSKISVRETSFKAMFKNILKIVSDYKYRRDAERTKFKLNLKISGCLADNKRRGWMLFFSRTENLNQLAHLDLFVKKQLRRVHYPEDFIPQIKTFIKTYHEISYNMDKTRFVPNFDNFTNLEKCEVISYLTPLTLSEARSLDIETIERDFSRLVHKEIQSLESDIGNLSYRESTNYVILNLFQDNRGVIATINSTWRSVA